MLKGSDERIDEGLKKKTGYEEGEVASLSKRDH